MHLEGMTHIFHITISIQKFESELAIVSWCKRSRNGPRDKNRATIGIDSNPIENVLASEKSQRTGDIF